MSDSDSIDAWKALSLSVSTTRRCMTAVCAGAGSEGDDNAAEQIPDVEVMQPAGFMALPALTATTEAMSVRRGDELIALFLVDKGAPAQAVESGETRLYGVGASNSAAVIRIRNSGAVEIASAGATVVKLQDGSQPFVRGTTFADALGTGIDALKTLNTAIGTFATAVGGATPAVAAAAVTLNTAIGAANTALDTLKAARSAYLSTKVSGQ